ncbi:MAG: hypothetical protein RIC55_05880 [Pirellulaceae bacterium]
MKMNDDVREWLSLSKDDFWAYPGLLLLAAACFLESFAPVAALMIGAALFFTIYFVRSLPKYFRKSNLARVTRVIGVLGNLLVLAILVIIVWGKLNLLLSGTTTVEFLRSFRPTEQRQEADPQD